MLQFVGWLDNVFGTKRTGDIMLSDPRRPVVTIALFLFLLLCWLRLHVSIRLRRLPEFCIKGCNLRPHFRCAL